MRNYSNWQLQIWILKHIRYGISICRQIGNFREYFSSLTKHLLPLPLGVVASYAGNCEIRTKAPALKLGCKCVVMGWLWRRYTSVSSSDVNDYSYLCVLIVPRDGVLRSWHPVLDGANRWGKNGNSERLYFLGSKITVDGDCSHEIKRLLLLGRKAMTNLDSILKSRDITLPTKACLVKAIVFPVVMYGCESRTIKKAEHQRIDAFELRCWRRFLRVPWTARRSTSPS